MREHLTVEELLRAMTTLLANGHDLKIEMWSYRVQNGVNADREWTRPKSEWSGGVAHEVRVQIGIRDTYIKPEELDGVLANIRQIGFVPYVSCGEDTLCIAVGTTKQQRIITEIPQPIGEIA